MAENNKSSVRIGVEVDTTELDEARTKAEKLCELLEKAGSLISEASLHGSGIRI